MVEPDFSTDTSPPLDEGTIPGSSPFESESSANSGDGSRDVENQRYPIEKKEAVRGDGPPDGGVEAWTVVMGAWCCSFCCFGWVNSQ
jgi:hypothetical protein